MDQLDSLQPLFKIKADQWTLYELQWTANPWIKDLLLELNEHSSYGSIEESLEHSELSIQLQLKRLQKPEWDQYLLIKADYQVTYHTQCVKTLQPIVETLQESFLACVVSHRLKDLEEFKDQTEIFTQADIYQLYFLEPNGQVNLSEIFHEQIYLNLNPFPQITGDQD